MILPYLAAGAGLFLLATRKKKNGIRLATGDRMIVTIKVTKNGAPPSQSEWMALANNPVALATLAARIWPPGTSNLQNISVTPAPSAGVAQLIFEALDDTIYVPSVREVDGYTITDVAARKL